MQHDEGDETPSHGTEEEEEETEFQDASLRINMPGFDGYDQIDLNNDDGAIASTSAETHPAPATPAQA